MKSYVYDLVHTPDTVEGVDILTTSGSFYCRDYSAVLTINMPATTVVHSNYR